nr:MAG TPA: hypothetical protein [Caudoviricetes sp.]
MKNESGMNVFTEKRRWVENNWSSIPVKNWTEYDEIVIVCDGGDVYYSTIRVPVLKKILSTSYTKVIAPAFGTDNAWVTLIPFKKDANRWNHSAALTTETKLSILDTKRHLYDIYGIKY